MKELEIINTKKLDKDLKYIEAECPDCAWPHNKVGADGKEGDVISDGYEDNITCAACGTDFEVELMIRRRVLSQSKWGDRDGE